MSLNGGTLELGTPCLKGVCLKQASVGLTLHLAGGAKIEISFEEKWKKATKDKLPDATEFRFEFRIEFRCFERGASERGTNERACERELQSSEGENPKAIIRTTDTTHDEKRVCFRRCSRRELS